MGSSSETVEASAKKAEHSAEMVDNSAETVEPSSKKVEYATETADNSSETLEHSAEKVELSAEKVECLPKVLQWCCIKSSLKLLQQKLNFSTKPTLNFESK
mgnify:FL=1